MGKTAFSWVMMARYEYGWFEKRCLVGGGERGLFVVSCVFEGFSFGPDEPINVWDNNGVGFCC